MSEGKEAKKMIKAAMVLAALFLTATLTAQDIPDLADHPLGPDDTRRSYVPSDAVPVAIQIVLSRRHFEGNAAIIAPQPEPGSDPTTTTIPVGDGQEITSEAEYQKLVGAPSHGIDWQTERVVVIQSYDTYRLGELDSRSELTAIWMDSQAIYIERHFTLFGSVMGIAQMSEWFADDVTDDFVLLPKRPAQIDSFTTGMENIPQNIP